MNFEAFTQRGHESRCVALYLVLLRSLLSLVSSHEGFEFIGCKVIDRLLVPAGVVEAEFLAQFRRCRTVFPAWAGTKKTNACGRLPDGRAWPAAFNRRCVSPGNVGSQVALLGRGLEVHSKALLIYLQEYGLENTCVGELLVLSVQSKSCPGIFNRVVRLQLDIFLEQVPSKELQTKLSLLGWLEKEIARVDDLISWHVYVDHAEVLLEAMTEEFAAQIEEDPHLLVDNLQRHECVFGPLRIKIFRYYARIGREIVDYHVLDMDIVINEWDALVEAISTQD